MKTKLKYNTDITIVDFWFKGCSPCLEDMKQFESLISGLEKKLTLVSISIDDVQTWKSIFSEKSTIPFLNKKINNWNHYVLTDTTIVRKDTIKKVRNGITIYSESSIQKMPGRNFIINEYGVKSFPTYLVLDKNGIIIEVPHKASDYIKEKFYNINRVNPFLEEVVYKDDFLFLILIDFVIYSIFYWLVVLIYTSIKRFRKKSTVANK